MNNSKSTICFFNSAIAWGGGEKWHLENAVSMHNSGYKVYLFAHPDSELKQRAEEAGLKVIQVRVTSFTFLNLFKLKKLISLLKSKSIHTIILNLSRDLKFAGNASKFAGIKRIIYRRGSAIPIKNTFTNRYLFKNIITDILTNTNATKKTVLQNNPDIFDKDKIEVIYNGIDFNKLLSISGSPIINKKEGELIIGNLGRLEKQKAQHYLLELAIELEKMDIQNFRILIAGSGRLEQSLKEKCQLLGLNKRIVFTGFINNVANFYESIDIFVLSSKWEGFGYVIVEAMAFEKPVVAFNISSNPEIIADKHTGFLVDFPNIKQLAEKTALLLSDPKLRKQFGQNGKERVLKMFSAEKQFKDFQRYIHT